MPRLTLLLSLLFSLYLSLISSANSITLPLFRVAKPSTTSPSENLKYLAAASLARAHRHKNLHTNAPLFAHRTGLYYVNLSFGTPPQNLSFIMDTGSSTVWFPCTTKYTCTQCDTPEVDAAHIPTFKPKSSSSSNFLTCQSQQCRSAVTNATCNNPSKTCLYRYRYGSGNTRGLLLSESLTFPELSVDNFTVGCSVSSVHVPEGGIVGFGRTGQSLPSQMDLESFSYCLQLQDNTTVSSDLVLTTKETKGSRATEYTTPFLQNPNVSSHPAFLEYYYVSVQKICVGKVNVKVPSGYLVPATNGSGGTIVDSGTTLTFMEKPMFDLVAREFVKQVANNYSRATEAEKELGLGLCYDVSGKQSLDYIPGLSFYFQGGGKMVLPLENYIVRYSGGICLAIITSIPAAKGKVWQGPAMILGNILQQNFYMDYDLKNNRLGFQKQECKRG